MLRAATEGDPLLEVSTVELEREAPSYTVETLEQLTGQYPGTPLSLILGADQWGGFGRWRRPRDIAALATIVLMAREGTAPSESGPDFGAEAPLPYIEVPVTRIDISSSLVRERVAAGRSVRYLLPEGVHRIIKREKLYLSE